MILLFVNRDDYQEQWPLLTFSINSSSNPFGSLIQMVKIIIIIIIQQTTVDQDVLCSSQYVAPRVASAVASTPAISPPGPYQTYNSTPCN